MKEFFKQKNKGRKALSSSKGFTHTPKFGVTPKGGGFTLIETLVAISIFSASIIGLMSVLASGVSDTNYAKQKMIASYLAQEGIECVRNTRDNYFLYTSTTGKTWEDFVGLDVQEITCPNIDDPNFTRVISITEISPSEVVISSSVSWVQGSGDHNITFLENLFNWI
jgi:Tfp pilus assembly protein PilV